jgi:ribosome-binding factor A
MKNIKSFDLFESTIGNTLTDPKLIKGEFDKVVKTIEGICSGISTAKEMQDKIKSMGKENADLSKNFLKYFELADNAGKLIAKIKKVGLSKDTKVASTQLRALVDMEEELKEAFDNLKVLGERTKDAFEQNEGILNVVGNFLRNVLTGKFVLNLVKNTKQNLLDSYTDMHKVEDVFDIHDY